MARRALIVAALLLVAGCANAIPSSRTDIANAYAGSNYIVLTRAMLARLTTVDALLGIIWHEQGHIDLGHTTRPNLFTNPLQKEIAADMFAAYKMQVCGYDREALTTVLQRFLDDKRLTEAGERQVRARIDILRNTVLPAGTEPCPLPRYLAP